MALKNGLRDLLLAEPSVGSLLYPQEVDRDTVDKVFVSTVDQGVTVPYLVISRTGHDPMGTLTNTTGMAQTEIDVDCFAATPAAADDLADAVEGYLKDYSGGAGNRDYIDCVIFEDKNDFENTEGDGNDNWRHAVTLSFTIFHHTL
jgi:hypothetical protein